ncbi:MAG: GNAT family N-acetyltransferase [Alphaproteobacteria bacterium]|nr:GNAT family N-acetyltransferase [Alphaproteobacteria bacterium]
MTMMASLRLATADDADTIAHLCRELLAFYGIPPPSSRWAMAEEIRERGLRDGRLEVLLAERDGVAVGLLIFFQVYSVALCQNSFFIQDLYVSERWRGEGIGRQMMEYLGFLAEQRGVGQIDWTADPWNDKSRRFYDRLGPHQRADKIFYRIAGPNLRHFIRKAQ